MQAHLKKKDMKDIAETFFLWTYRSWEDNLFDATNPFDFK